MGSMGSMGSTGCSTDVLQEAQQVGDSLTLAVGQHGVVDAVLGAAFGGQLARARDDESFSLGGELTAAAGREELRSEAGQPHGGQRHWVTAGRLHGGQTGDGRWTRSWRSMWRRCRGADLLGRMGRRREVLMPSSLAARRYNRTQARPSRFGR